MIKIKSLILRCSENLIRYALIAINYICRTVAHCVKRFPQVKKFACGALAIVLTVAILFTIASYSGLTYALEVTVNGTSYGYVHSQRDADTAIDMISEQVVSSSSAPEDEIVAEYTHTIATHNSIVTSDKLCRDIIDGEDKYVSAVLIFVNDTAVAKADTEEEARAELAVIEGDNIFYNNVKVSACNIESSMYDELPELRDALKLNLPTHINYEILKKDTLASVAKKFDVGTALIDALNTSVEFKAGNVINIVVDVPAFAVITEDTYKNSYSVAAGVYDAKAGTVTEQVVAYYVGGFEFSREVVSTTFKAYAPKPVAKKPTNVGNAGFCWPVDKAYYHYISSYWGDGRGHEAVDIAGKVGIPILSAQGGVVESVNRYGSAYGKHFVINHGNGLKTLYAHCSTVYVSVGSKVSRGEVVALMGNTGRSTGPHLHFEVWKNGVRVNPCSYLGI